MMILALNFPWLRNFPTEISLLWNFSTLNFLSSIFINDLWSSMINDLQWCTGITLFIWESLTSVSERYICTKVPDIVSSTKFLAKLKCQMSLMSLEGWLGPGRTRSGRAGPGRVRLTFLFRFVLGNFPLFWIFFEYFFGMLFTYSEPYLALRTCFI